MREKQERKSLEQRENAKLGRGADGIFVQDVKETHMGDMRGTEKTIPPGGFRRGPFFAMLWADQMQVRQTGSPQSRCKAAAHLSQECPSDPVNRRGISFHGHKNADRELNPVGVSLFVSGLCNRQSTSLPERVQTGLRPGLLYPSGSFFMRFLGTTII